MAYGHRRRSCNGGGTSSLTEGCGRNSIRPVMLRFASRAERAVAVPGRPVAPVRELAARDIQQLQLLADAGQVPTRFVDIGRLVIAVADIGLSLGGSPAGRRAHVVSAPLDIERPPPGIGELEKVGASVLTSVELP